VDVLRGATAGMLEEVRLSYQDQLIDCIMWVLVSHPDLHYYQARFIAVGSESGAATIATTMLVPRAGHFQC